MKITAQVTKSINGKLRIVGLEDGKDYSSKISPKVVERAQQAGKLIRFDPSDKVYQGSKFILASRIKFVDDNREVKGSADPATDFILNAASNLPGWLKFNKIKWNIMARNVFRQASTLVVGPTGNGKTTVAIELAKAVGYPYYVFNLGSTQDPRSALIGTMAYSKEKGTYFKKSNFIKALETENSVIVLDEITRAHPEAFNIILPLLDFQKTIRIEENNEVIRVADGVSFIATANIGMEYTSTRLLDRALVDRFIRIDVGFLTKKQETAILRETYTGLTDAQINALTSLSDVIRLDLATESPKVSTHISTRMLISTAGLVADGFGLDDAINETILPHYDSDGGADSEQTFVAQAFQKCYTVQN